MKRISFWLIISLVALPAMVRAQDAATEERLNKLSAQIEVLIEAKDAQNKKIEALAKAVDDLQQQINKPSGNYASSEEVKQLADKIREVDQKRQDDNEKILKSVKEDLRRIIQGAPIKTSTATSSAGSDAPVSDKGFEYTIQSGDTLAAIISAYREKNIKVSLDDILKANPGLKPEKMRVGQTIFIPKPGQ